MIRHTNRQTNTDLYFCINTFHLLFKFYRKAVLEGNLRKIEEIIDVFIAMNGPRKKPKF